MCARNGRMDIWVCSHALARLPASGASVAIVIPTNTLMTITEQALNCLGLFGSIGRVLNVMDVDADRRLWVAFELSDAFDVHTHNRMVLNVPDTVLDFCDTRQQWAERKRRAMYGAAA